MVSLKVYDVVGREVAVLEDGVVDPGFRSASFNAAALSSGVYFCRLSITPENGKPQS